MHPKNKYGIIIEKTINDWKNSMINQKEKWEIPKYSKPEINKAGSIIANHASSKEERKNAISILNNWRAAHAYPLQVICNNLRMRNPNAIVVQRLKRLESITGKIERFPDMNLYRMQDLGGCRVIVDTIEQVYDSVKYSLQGTTRRPRNGLLTTNGAMLPARGIAPVCCGGIQRGQRPIWHTTLRSKV